MCPKPLTLIVLALAACAAPPPPVPPTLVNITIKAGPTINPAADGTPSPVVLRVYQLGSASGFSNAEFYPLYKADAATLGSDLIKRDDTPLNPGDSKTLALSPTEAVKAIGVMAGLRDFAAGGWRASTDITAHRTTDLTVIIDHAGIAMKAAIEPLPKKPAA
jgi:type VI secretion system protein VasD